MLTISTSIDPLSQRAAIDALEAQRAAYRRVARQAEAQQAPLAAGDFDRVSEFTDGIAQDVTTLHDGAHAVRNSVDSLSSQGSEDQVRELERRMDDMMREARNAETAIRNLTTQLEAWRDAYGRQLSDAGLSPGSASSDDPTPEPSRPTYGAKHSAPSPPRILDRRG